MTTKPICPTCNGKDPECSWESTDADVMERMAESYADFLDLDEENLTTLSQLEYDHIVAVYKVGWLACRQHDPLVLELVKALEDINDTPGLGGLDFTSEKKWRRSTMNIIDRIAREALNKWEQSK